MTRTWPTRISLGSLIPFAAAMAATVVPNFAAMPLSVSPDCTLYRRVPVGACVGAGVTFDGAGVDAATGEDVGAAVRRTASGIRADAEAPVAGPGEPVASSGDALATTPPRRRRPTSDGPCAEGVVRPGDHEHQEREHHQRDQERLAAGATRRDRP